jgi:flagellar assembly protein FliH
MPSSDRSPPPDSPSERIARHQATGAYRRWTPPSFDDPATDAEPAAADETAPAEITAESSPAPAAPPPTPATPAEPDDPPVKLPTAEDIEAMFEQARKDGEHAGYREGREQADAEARAESARIGQLVRSMDEALDRIGGEIAEEIVELALALARQMVGNTLQTRPEAILPVVTEALQQMPQGKVRIHLHPEDLKLVRQHMEDSLEGSHHQLIEDTTIERGGCHLEAAGCNIDATMATRWERVLASIGRSGTGADDDA